MNKSTIEHLRETGDTISKTCEAFAKELERDHMRQVELLAYSNDLEAFLQDTIKQKFKEVRASIFLRTQRKV